MSDKLELYKLEYEKAADRYQEIYKSMWTIFSYLTAVSAGILTLGASKIQPSALWCLASLPLLFWYWTTYLPLDRYGNKVAIRLANLERHLNANFGVTLDHFVGLAGTRSATDPGVVLELVKLVWGVICGVGKRESLGLMWEQVHRARFAITVFLIALHVFTACQGLEYRRSRRPLFLAAQSEPARGNDSASTSVR